MKKKHADKFIFLICLVASLALFIGGFFCPPMGVIDGSILTAAGILLAFATLAVAAQNLANGKDLTFKKGDMEVTIDEEQ